MLSNVAVKTIKDGVYEWIKAVVDCMDVIEENPNAKRPKPPYASFLINPFVKDGQDAITKTDESDTSFEISGQRHFTCSVKVYGENCQQLAFNLQSSLESPRILDMLSAAGLAVWNEPSCTDISAKLETGIERRMNLDVIFGFATTLAENLAIIETVEELGGTFDTPIGSVEVESTITE